MYKILLSLYHFIKNKFKKNINYIENKYNKEVNNFFHRTMW